MRTTDFALRDSQPCLRANQPVPLGMRLRVADLLARPELELALSDPSVGPEDTLVEGELLERELRPGLVLHAGHAREQHAFSLTTTPDTGLSCVFLLEGAITLLCGDRTLELGGGRPRAIDATAVVRTRPERFRRVSREPQHLRHVVVTASPEWLGLEGLDAAWARPPEASFLRRHLHTYRWTPNGRLTELVRSVLAPAAYAPALQNLFLEARAVEIVVESLSALRMAEREPRRGATELSRHDRIRLNRARELIASQLDRPLSVAAIAREAGASPSGLQRLFQRAEGQSVFEYIRRLRLERAHDALSAGDITVQQASVLAGYNSAANFATAFKRRFSLTPSEALGRAAKRTPRATTAPSR
jgi:AraC-like DNA-binding protein